MSAPFMRFVVRPDCQGGMVGINYRLFKEGVVYEVIEVLGEYVIREKGPSPLALPLGEAIRPGFSNGRDYNSLYQELGGSVVRTIEEILGK